MSVRAPAKGVPKVTKIAKQPTTGGKSFPSPATSKTGGYPAPANLAPGPTPTHLGPASGTDGTVDVKCAALGITLTMWCAEAAPTLTAGFGGIQRVARPRRVSLPDYQGVDPLAMQIDARIDRWIENVSVEPECAAVFAMSRDTSSRTGAPPVTVTGPVPVRGLTWLVDDVAWGTSLWTGDYRVRQDITLTFVQLVQVDTVATSPAKRAASKKAAPGKPKVTGSKPQPTTTLKKRA